MSSRRKQFKPKSAIDVVDGTDQTDKINQSLTTNSCSMLVSSANDHSDECNERKRKRSTSDADGSDSDSGSDSALHNDTMNDIDDFDNTFDRLNQSAPHTSDSLDHSDYSRLNHSVMLLMFKCRVCGKGFKHRRSLNRHVKLHSGEKNFKCHICTTAFARSDHLKAHLRTHNNSKPYRCSICQCGYSTQAALKVHIAHHHSKSKFKCVLCNELEFHSQLALEGHMYTMHSKENETADLNELINQTATMNPTLVSVDESGVSQRTKLTDINNLIKHEDVLYEPKTEPTISINMTVSPSKPCKIAPKSLHCDQCDVTFSNMDSYLTHMRNCHNQKPSINTHDLNYTTETQYQCSQCSLSLFKLNDYLQHIKREHCVEVYRCVLCKQMQLFDNLNLLKEHFFQVHESVRVETYKCRLCAHTSISLDELSAHLASAHAQSTHSVEHQSNQSVRLHSVEHQSNQSVRLHSGEHQSNQSVHLQYSCQYCRNAFSNKAQLERHVRIHLATIDLKCNICDRQFDNELQLAQHKLTHSLAVKVTCSFCQQPIENESHFKDHFKRHNNIGQPHTASQSTSGKMSYSCVVCRQQLTSNSEYLTHMKSHLAVTPSKKLELDVKRESSGACPLSPATTTSSASSTTSQKTAEPFLCEICSSKFDSNFKLQTHLLLKHEYGNLVNATYSCPVCDEAYNRADLLLQHTQIHGPAAKIYKCTACSAAFVFKSQLINHSFSHQTKNVSTSSILYQQLSQSLQCKREPVTDVHNQSQYVVNTNANGSKTFTCLTCSKTFANQRNLNVHMRIHTGFRPFECDICQRKFTRRENLRSHMKCHLNLRPFTCSICNRSFRRKSHVSSHIEVHFKSKVHNCIECEQQFDQLPVFLHHLIAEHNIYDKELLLLIKSKQLLDLDKLANVDCEYVLSQPSGSPASMSLSSKPCAQQTVAHNAIPPLHHYQSLKTDAIALVADCDAKYLAEEEDEEQVSQYNGHGDEEEEEDAGDEDEDGLVIEDADYVDEDEMPAQHVNSVYMDGDDDGSLGPNGHLNAHLHEQDDTDNGDLGENDSYDCDQSIDYTD